jgi:hypothetical protein
MNPTPYFAFLSEQGREMLLSNNGYAEGWLQSEIDI